MFLIKQSRMLKGTLQENDKLSEPQLLELTADTQSSSLLPCRKAQLNGVLTLVYDTKAYNTLESCASHLTAEQFRQILCELLATLRRLEQQSHLSGLQMGNLRVEFDNIYVHHETLQPAFVYTPLETAPPFAEEELRGEIISTIHANECLRDGVNAKLSEFLRIGGNNLFDLITLIPTLEQAEAAAPTPVVNDESLAAIRRLSEDNARMRRTLTLVSVAVVIALLVLIFVLLVDRNKDDDAPVQQVTQATELPTEPVVLMRGDLDGDGKLTDADTKLLDAFTTGRQNLTDAQYAAADVDGNGVVDTKDYAKLILEIGGGQK